MAQAVGADGEGDEGDVTHEPGDLLFAADSARYIEDEQEWAEDHGFSLGSSVRGVAAQGVEPSLYV